MVRDRRTAPGSNEKSHWLAASSWIGAIANSGDGMALSPPVRRLTNHYHRDFSAEAGAEKLGSPGPNQAKLMTTMTAADTAVIARAKVLVAPSI